MSHEMCVWRGADKKARIVPLSPYVEKPLNSKVIKSFVPELRSRKCFLCFEIPMFYVIYVYIYEHYMSILHIHVHGYGTLLQLSMMRIYINCMFRITA